MSEEKKKAMNELIKFSEKWMEKFDDKEKLIFSGQEIKDILGLSEKIYGGIYKEDDIDYDPDSSPFAWKYYHLIYKFVIEFNDNNKNDYYEKYKYTRDGITYTRNIAVFNWNDAIINKPESDFRLKQTKKSEYSNDKHLQFGGDCAFNFNNLKYARFLKLVNNKDLYNKLNFCAMMHHSPLNFALMPRTGAMNCVKGRAGNHDRLDKFLYNLNDYYSNCRDDHNILTGQSYLGNREALKEFLLDVQGDEVEKTSNTTKETKEIQVGTRNYVKLFYPWVDEKLLTSLIKNGQQPITDADNLNTYMDLAIEYWTAASEYYNAHL